MLKLLFDLPETLFNLLGTLFDLPGTLFGLLGNMCTHYYHQRSQQLLVLKYSGNIVLHPREYVHFIYVKNKDFSNCQCQNTSGNIILPLRVYVHLIYLKIIGFSSCWCQNTSGNTVLPPREYLHSGILSNILMIQIKTVHL